MFITKRHYVEVFLTKLQLNLHAEASKTYLGYLWWILEPALFVAVFYYVFAVFLQRGAENFVAFLLCGKVPYLWFAKSINNSSQSIKAGRGLINQVRINKAFFPLLVVGQDLVKQSLVFTLMLVFLVAYGISPSLQWISVLFVLVTQLAVIVPCTLIAAAITAFIPDFRYLIQTGMLLLLFGSGIFYSYTDVILPRHQELFLLNPLARLIKNYRQVLLDSQPPDWYELSTLLAGSLILTFFVLKLYRKADFAFARLATE
jgi:lipopolysaccharide transport system permease protein